MLVSRSTDGGITWSNPTTLIRDGAQAFNDKESITADPTRATNVYAVWDRLLSATRAPTVFARTTDGGNSWEAARTIYDPGDRRQTLGNEIVVLPDGTLVNFFSLLDLDGNGNVLTAALTLIRSVDQGVSWSAPIKVADLLAVGARDPETGATLRDGSFLPRPAVSKSGELFAVWQDARTNLGVRDAVLLARSSDKGLTWSAPVVVNRVAAVAAFTPTVAVSANGTIGVTYYNFRNNTTDPSTLPTDYWLVQSTDGLTWTETHIAGPFDIQIAANARGLFLGDYMSLGTMGNTLVPFFGKTNSGDLVNRSDIYVAFAGAQKLLDASAQQARYQASLAGKPAVAPAFRQQVEANLERLIRRRVPEWERLRELGP